MCYLQTKIYSLKPSTVSVRPYRDNQRSSEFISLKHQQSTGIGLLVGLMMVSTLSCHKQGSHTPPEYSSRKLNNDVPTPALANSGANPGYINIDALIPSSEYSKLRKLNLNIEHGGNISKISTYPGETAMAPQALKALVHKQHSDATIENYELELYLEHGRVHELEFILANKKECEIAMLDNGELLYEECEVPITELPVAIIHSVKKTIPDGIIDEVEKRELKDETHEWRIEVKMPSNTSIHYLRYDSSGKLLGHNIKVEAEVRLPVDL